MLSSLATANNQHDQHETCCDPDRGLKRYVIHSCSPDSGDKHKAGKLIVRNRMPGQRRRLQQSPSKGDAFIDAYPHRGPDNSKPFVAEPCLSLRDRRGRPASETGFLPCIESRYRWTLRLRRRIISITSKNPAVSQSTVCMIMSFMTGGSPFLSLELLHHREEIFEYL
jgi:hypothetical protein